MDWAGCQRETYFRIAWLPTRRGPFFGVIEQPWGAVSGVGGGEKSDLLC